MGIIQSTEVTIMERVELITFTELKNSQHLTKALRKFVQMCIVINVL